MKPLARHFKREGGFTIVESLVALLIMTFGMLAISGMQMTLSHNSDTARHRTEATRLANEKMEELRSFTDITTGTITWNGLADGTDVITTNATYTRTWSLAGTLTDAFRPVSVAVAWIDRSGETNGITLNSVISKTDPSDVGFLGFPLPENSPLKRVKNRSLDIPIPAISLIGANQGLSAYNLSGTNLSVVFSDYNGAVVKSCPSYLTAGSSLANCTTITAVIVAGYIHDKRIGTSYDYRSTVTTYITEYTTTYTYSPTTTTITTPVYGYGPPTQKICAKLINPRLSGCKNSENGGVAPTYAAKPYCFDTQYTTGSCSSGYSQVGTTLTYTVTSYITSTTTSYVVTGTQTTYTTIPQYNVTTGSKNYAGMQTGTNAISTTGISWWDVSSGTAVATATKTVTCIVDQAVNQNDGTTQIQNYKYYLCVIYLDTNVLWSGTVRLKGIPTDSTVSTKQFVGCRYQYKDTSLGDGGRNYQPYYLLGDSIDNQNYLIDFSTNGTEGSTPMCPTDTLTVTNQGPLNAELTAALQAAAELVVHQDCRNLASNTSISTNCPQ
jgi:Tfp pilus assembly protein PilV